MSSESDTLRENIRFNTIDILRTIASATEQLEYERNVPIVSIPVELCCMWFDDFYHPDSKPFQGAFSEAELALLADFNELFDQSYAQLPPHPPSIAVWLDDAVWQRIMGKAEETLRQLRLLHPEEERST